MVRIKGFIGPLGDDIPALFPIIAGVLIFITSLIYINQQIDDRNQYLNIRSSTLRMSYIVTDRGLMEDARFATKCDAELGPFALKEGIDFAVVLKKYCGPVEFSGDEVLYINRRTTAFGTTVDDFVCSSAPEIESTAIGDKITIPSRDSVTMSFPVAVDCGEPFRGIGIISVSGWRPVKK